MDEIVNKINERLLKETPYNLISNSSDNEKTIFHEAGHIVIAYYESLDLEYTSASPTNLSGNILGYTIVKFPTDSNKIRCYIKQAFAGVITQRLYFEELTIYEIEGDYESLKENLEKNHVLSDYSPSEFYEIFEETLCDIKQNNIYKIAIKLIAYKLMIKPYLTYKEIKAILN